MFKRLMPLGLAIVFAVPALGEPGASFDSGVADVRRGLAAAPTQPPTAKRAPASREIERANLPADLKDAERTINEARHLIMNDCKIGITSIANAETAFKNAIKDDPNQQEQVARIKELFHQAQDIADALSTASSLLNRLEGWLDSAANEHPSISAKDLAEFRGTGPKFEELLDLNEEAFTDSPKDPSHQRLNSRLKEDIDHINGLAIALSAAQPDKATDWTKKANSISKEAYLREITLIRSVARRTETSGDQIANYATKAGWVSSAN